MLVHDVLQLSPTDRFLYWIRERHAIHLRRQSGQPAPWTDDEILQKHFFTNPFRENDKTTAWFRNTVRDPLRDDPAVILATVIFRWFNYIPTGEILMAGRNLLLDWDEAEVLARLRPIRDVDGKVFTGAFMVNSPPGEPKLEAICRRITKVWTVRKFLLRYAEEWRTMQAAHNNFIRYDGLGGFGAYEVVCDLRYTRFLEHATDKMIWSNPGPGAVRGLYRVLGRPLTTRNNSSCPPVPRDWEARTRELLQMAQAALADLPPLEMRDIEHSLCESDKYIRLLLKEGRAKRQYEGAAA